MFHQRAIAIATQYVEQTLTDTCQISRPAGIIGEYGESQDAEWDVVGVVPCRVIRAGNRNSGAVQDAGGSEAIVEIYRVILPIGTEIGAGYAITIDDTQYEVTNLDNALSQQTHIQAIVTRARHG